MGTEADLPRIVHMALSRHCRRHRCSPEDRADLSQDAYIAAYGAHSTYDPAAGASHSTWVTRRVQGQLLDSARKMRSRGMTHLSPDMHHVAPTAEPAQSAGSEPYAEVADDTLPDQDALARADEVAAAIRHLKQRLKPEQFNLLAMHYGLDGEAMSLREIAPKLGIAHQAVHQRLERVLLQARGILQMPARRPHLH